MADLADRANDEQYWTRRAIEQKRLALKNPDLPSAFTCASCEEPIPEARRAKVPGVQYCLECQEEMDRK